MMSKKNLIRMLEKLPDDVEINLCILSEFQDTHEEVFAVLERVNLEDLKEHNIVYLEGKE